MSTPLEETLRSILVKKPGAYDASAFLAVVAVGAGAPAARAASGGEEAASVRSETGALISHLQDMKAALQQVDASVSREIRGVREASESFQSSYNKALSGHRVRLETVQSNVERLETRLHQAGVMPKRVGQLLVSTEQQRRRLVQAGTLLRMYQKFQSLEELKPGDDEAVRAGVDAFFTDEGSLQEATRLLPSLKRVCHGLEGDLAQRARHNIQQTSDFVERRLLDRFEASAKAEPIDVGEMRRCAVPLCRYFNGGASLHNRYFNGVVMPKLLELQASGSAGSASDQLSSMFGAIHAVCSTHFRTIRRVFPPESVVRVTRMLVQRVLNDPLFGIQARVEEVLSPQPPQPPLPLVDYLDVLCMVHEKTTALFLMLTEAAASAAAAAEADREAARRERSKQQHHTAERRGFESDSADERAPALSSAESDASEAIKAYLDEQTTQLFRDHRQNFLAKAQYHLALSLDAALRDACGPHLAPAPAAAPRALGPEALPCYRPPRGADCAAIAEGPLEPSALRAACEAHQALCDRCKAILSGDERAGAVARSFAALAKVLHRNWLLPALEHAASAAAAAHWDLSDLSGRGGEALRGLMQLLVGCQAALDEVEGHFAACVAPEVRLSSTPRTIANDAARRFADALEELSSSCLTGGLGAFVAAVEHRLAEAHGCGAYAPRGELSGEEFRVTPALESVVSGLGALRATLDNALPGVDLGVVWATVGRRVRDGVLALLLSVKVSVSGAFQLKVDLDAVCGAFRAFGRPEVDRLFEELNEVVTLFMVPGDALQALLADGALGRLSSETLAQLLKRRADYRVHGRTAAWAQELLADLGDHEHDHDSGAEEGRSLPPSPSAGPQRNLNWIFEDEKVKLTPVESPRAAEKEDPPRQEGARQKKHGFFKRLFRK